MTHNFLRVAHRMHPGYCPLYLLCAVVMETEHKSGAKYKYMCYNSAQVQQLILILRCVPSTHILHGLGPRPQISISMSYFRYVLHYK